MSSKLRPTGVKIIVGLEIIAGLIILTVGLLPFTQIILQPGQFGLAGIVLLPFFLILSILLLVVAIVVASLFFILARRLWRGGNSARKITLTLSILGLAFSLFFGLAGGWYAGPFLKGSPTFSDYAASFLTFSALILNVPLLYFLTRKDVKEFYKK